MSFAQFVGPDDECVVEQAAGVAGFGSCGQFLQEVIQLAGEPLVNFDQLGQRLLILVGFVRQAMVLVGYAQPVHSCLADGLCELQAWERVSSATFSRIVRLGAKASSWKVIAIGG